MKRYSGKNSWWFILIYVLINLMPLLMFLKDDIAYHTIFIMTYVFYYLLINLIFIPILVRNAIVLYDDYFIFYYGFSKRKVWINKIKSIEKSRSIIASSANSLDRIYIETKDDELMVALKKNDEFIDVIKKKMSEYSFSDLVGCKQSHEEKR